MITNNSPYNLQVGLINPVAANPNFSNSLTIDVTDTTKFITATSANPGHTDITISNTSSTLSNISLANSILNQYGPVTISVFNGSIFDDPNANNSTPTIEASALSLKASQGAIGSSGDPILTELSNTTEMIGSQTLSIIGVLVQASALNGIWIDQTGDLEIGNTTINPVNPADPTASTSPAVSSINDSVNLTATGSILDNAPDLAVDIAGPTINLSAGTGSIGTTGDALRIDAGTSETLNAVAATGINVTSIAASVVLGTITSTTGDITIGTTAAGAVGQAITANATSFVDAKAGNVNFNASGNIIDLAGSIIEAATGDEVNFTGDVGDPDPGVGTLIVIAGTITATGGVFLTGGANEDAFVVRKVTANSPMTINTGGAADTIVIGSLASASINTSGGVSLSDIGGVLSTIAATLTIAGNSERARRCLCR